MVNSTVPEVPAMPSARRLPLAAVALAAGVAGCKFLERPDTAVQPTTPRQSLAQRTPQDLVQYLNTQASYVQNLSYSDVRLKASDNGETFTLGDTSLFAARPNNVRLIAGHTVLGKQLDIGSNEREFWVYVKQLRPDNFFYCSHEEFEKGTAKFPVPFDTDWVMQALGMATFPTDGQYEIQTRDREYVLTQRTTTRNGVPVTKQMVFNADWDGGNRPIVRRHVIADDRGQKLAVAEIRNVRSIKLGPPNNPWQRWVQVPTEVTLEWPQQKFKMDLVLRGEKLNDDLSDRFAALFTRPRIPGTNPIDLATYQFNATPSSYRGQAPDGTGRRAYTWFQRR